MIYVHVSIFIFELNNCATAVFEHVSGSNRLDIIVR